MKAKHKTDTKLLTKDNEQGLIWRALKAIVNGRLLDGYEIYVESGKYGYYTWLSEKNTNTAINRYNKSIQKKKKIGK